MNNLYKFEKNIKLIDTKPLENIPISLFLLKHKKRLLLSSLLSPKLPPHLTNSIKFDSAKNFYFSSNQPRGYPAVTTGAHKLSLEQGDTGFQSALEG